MNKYQEALNELVRIAGESPNAHNIKQQYTALKELVDLYTPKKPVTLFTFVLISDPEKKERNVMGCPNCRMPIEKYETEIPRHCHMCGQAMDRSRDEPTT